MRIGVGVIAGAFALMTQVPSDHAANVLAGWFRDSNLPSIADWLSSPTTEYFIRHYAVWGLGSIVAFCLFWDALSGILKRIIARLKGENPAIILRPDVKVSDAIDYIVNDSIANLEKPLRLETLGNYPPRTIITVSSAEHEDARRQLRISSIAAN